MKRLGIVLLAATLAGCSGTATRVAPPPTTFYQELGGQPAIEALVDALLKEVHGDQRIIRFFADTDLVDLRRLIVEQLCNATGGPCEYTGRSMEEAHSGMDISEAEFGYFVEDLQRAMNTIRLPADKQQRVIALLAPMKPEVVGQ